MWYVLQILFSSLAPACMIAIGAIPAAILLKIWRGHAARSQRRTPLTRDMLRPPGYSLSQRLAEVGTEIDSLVSLLLVIPLVVYAAHVSQSHFFNDPDTGIRVVASVAAVIVFEIACVWRINRHLQTKRNLQAGLDGEQATGEELNQLLRVGCRVFHDVPCPYGNIDHVVIGPSGVSSVETKIVGKLPKDEGEARVTVDNSAGTVHFPNATWRIPAAQLESQAKWLKNFVRESTGLDAPVEPMLALPGWFIAERKGISPAGIFVINPVNAERFFVRSRRVLSDEAIQRISHQLEQRCRDVEPAHKRDPPKIAG